MNGRWLTRLITGMALISKVKRVAVSYERMPRSQRMTSRLPWERMYSAASSHSSMVARSILPDEFFLVRFADEPDLLTDFTSSIEEVQNQLLYSRPEGRTALLDALYLALATMRDAPTPRTPLLVFFVV